MLTKAHEAGELDDGFGVGFDGELLPDLHGDLGPGVLELDILDAADLDAGHLDEVALLQFLGGLEAGGDVIAARKEAGGADHFEDDDGGDEGEGEEDAEPGFEGVFHEGSWR